MAFWWLTAAALGGLSVILFYIKKSKRAIRCTCSSSMRGKTVIITGANCGIGKMTALNLASRHAKVIMACRDIEKANRAIQDIRKVTQNGYILVHKLDLSSFASVRKFCQNIIDTEERLDVLINNAAVMNHPFQTTENGLEINMAVNHFGNFLMTNLLLDLLKRSSPSRIIFVSSSLHKKGKIDFENINKKQSKPYCNSKLANVYFARELYLRLEKENSGISVHTLSPGMVNTDLGRYSAPHILRLLFKPLAYCLLKSPEEGCQTIVHCAVSLKLNGISGGYYINCEETQWSDISRQYVDTCKLWDLSEQLTCLKKTL